jgi:hypothetical protein
MVLIGMKINFQTNKQCPLFSGIVPIVCDELFQQIQNNKGSSSVCIFEQLVSEYLFLAL